MSFLYSVEIDDGKIIFTNKNKLELMDDAALDRMAASSLRPEVDLSGYNELKSMQQSTDSVQSIIDNQLKKIRLLRLQAANRLRAVRLKNEREQKRNKQSDMYSMLSSYDKANNNNKRKKDKSNNNKSKHKKHANSDHQKAIKAIKAKQPPETVPVTVTVGGSGCQGVL